MFSTKEDKILFHKHQQHQSQEVSKMPLAMRDLIATQFFTWIGIFCFFVFYSMILAQNVYGLPAGADINGNPLYRALLEKGVLLNVRELSALYF